jgi:large subunit ribosomal protein L32
MPVPKRKTSRSATRSRKSANMRLARPAHSLCPQGGNSKLPHTVCGTCGWYRGRQVLDVD